MTPKKMIEQLHEAARRQDDAIDNGEEIPVCVNTLCEAAQVIEGLVKRIDIYTEFFDTTYDGTISTLAQLADHNKEYNFTKDA